MVYFCGLLVQKLDHKKIRGLCRGLLDQETKPRMALWSMLWLFRPLKQTVFFLVQRTWSNKAIK